MVMMMVVVKGDDKPDNHDVSLHVPDKQTSRLCIPDSTNVYSNTSGLLPSKSRRNCVHSIHFSDCLVIMLKVMWVYFFHLKAQRPQLIKTVKAFDVRVLSAGDEQY